jgi:hypothetical protein
MCVRYFEILTSKYLCKLSAATERLLHEILSVYITPCPSPFLCAVAVISPAHFRHLDHF